MAHQGPWDAAVKVSSALRAGLLSLLRDDMAAEIHGRLEALLDSCVLPFASRDGSSSFSRVLGARSSLRPALDQIRASFSGFGVSWDRWVGVRRAWLLSVLHS